MEWGSFRWVPCIVITEEYGTPSARNYALRQLRNIPYWSGAFLETVCSYDVFADPDPLNWNSSLYLDAGRRLHVAVSGWEGESQIANDYITQTQMYDSLFDDTPY